MNIYPMQSYGITNNLINTKQHYNNKNIDVHFQQTYKFDSKISFHANRLTKSAKPDLPAKLTARLSSIQKQHIMENLTKKNKPLAVKLLGMKDKDGYRFDKLNDTRYSEVAEILKRTNDKNIDSAEMLTNAKDKDGNPRFKSSEIYSLLEQITKENHDLLAPILAIDNPRLDEILLIWDILQSVTADNFILLEPLLTMVNDNGSYRFDHYIDGYDSDIELILRETNADNVDSVLKFMNAKNKEEKYIANSEDIYENILMTGTRMY